MNTTKFNLLLAIAGCLLCLSCTEKPVQDHTTPGDTITKMVLSASLPNAETKTMISENGGDFDVVWKEGDKISVNGALSNAVSQADNGEKVVDFTVEGSHL